MTESPRKPIHSLLLVSASIIPNPGPYTSSCECVRVCTHTHTHAHSQGSISLLFKQKELLSFIKSSST